MSVTPNIKVQILENRYEMLCESKIMYGIEVWKLIEAWKELDKVHRTFCKKLMGIPNCAVNKLAEMELGRESRRGKCTGQTLTFWHRNLTFKF
jgi:hypothetical protein